MQQCLPPPFTRVLYTPPIALQWRRRRAAVANKADRTAYDVRLLFGGYVLQVEYGTPIYLWCDYLHNVTAEKRCCGQTIGVHPTAKVSEELVKKCRPVNTIVQLSTPTPTLNAAMHSVTERWRARRQYDAVLCNSTSAKSSHRDYDSETSQFSHITESVKNSNVAFNGNVGLCGNFMHVRNLSSCLQEFFRLTTFLHPCRDIWDQVAKLFKIASNFGDLWPWRAGPKFLIQINFINLGRQSPIAS